MPAPATASADPSSTAPWNRRVEGVALAPVGGDHWEARVVWTTLLAAPTPYALDLSTDVVVRVGQKQTVTPAKVKVGAGTEACASGSGEVCGSAVVDGVPQTLLCLPDGSGVACRLPPIVTSVPIQPKPGETVVVELVATSGAVAEIDLTDDVRAVAFDGGPIFWDRRVESVKLVPTVDGTHHAEAEINLGLLWGGSTGGVGADVTPRIVLSVNGVESVHGPPPGSWIVAPAATCHQAGPWCGVLLIDGVPATMTCMPYDNAFGSGYSCSTASIPYLISAVPLSPDDVVTVSVSAAPGALPELEGLDGDVVVSCGAKASSTAYGAGKKGTYGVPKLHAAAPVLGNSSGITLKNALPGALPILVVGLSASALPFDGGTLLVEPAVIVPWPTPVGANGMLEIAHEVPTNPQLCGTSHFVQMLVPDPGATGVHQLALTNGLQRTFGS